MGESLTFMFKFMCKFISNTLGSEKILVFLLLPPPDHTICYLTAKSSLQPSIHIFRKSNLANTVYTQDKKHSIFQHWLQHSLSTYVSLQSFYQAYVCNTFC